MRSFLFLAIALALARTLNVSEIFIPENGIIAINAPTQVSRMGSCSTRTAHPRYLLELQSLLRDSGLYSGAIRNPFLFKSKTDMVAEAPKALHATLLNSISCSRPNRYKNLHVRHCGYCVPCIYRRVALATAGIDRPSDYAFSVFDEPNLVRDKKGADLRALAAFAKTVVKTSPQRRDDIVLSHGFFPTSVGAEFGPQATSTYEPWSNMLLRWAQGFLKAGSRFNPEVRRALGVPALPAA